MSLLSAGVNTTIIQFEENDNANDNANDDGVHGPFGNLNLVALGPKIPALLSLAGSYVIIREAIADLRQQGSGSRRTTNNTGCNSLSRTLIALSVADMASSTAWFLSTWMFPSDMLDDAWGNVGNWATCNMQGFLIEFGISAGPLFNTLYAFFSLLLLRYRWTDRDLTRMEPYCQIAIWLVAIALATFPIPMKLYNPFGQVCWIESHPLDCEESDNEECIRGGEHVRVYSVVFTFFPVWPCILAAAVSLFFIWNTVRETENRLAQYSFRRIVHVSNKQRKASSSSPTAAPVESDHPEEAPTTTGPHHTTIVLNRRVNKQAEYKIKRERSQAVKWQAIWYLLVFMATYLLDMVNYITLASGHWYEALDWFAYFVYPMQGFFNFMVFCYRRKATDMKTVEGRTLRRLLCCTVFRNVAAAKAGQPTSSSTTAAAAAAVAVESTAHMESIYQGQHESIMPSNAPAP